MTEPSAFDSTRPSAGRVVDRRDDPPPAPTPSFRLELLALRGALREAAASGVIGSPPRDHGFVGRAPAYRFLRGPIAGLAAAAVREGLRAPEYLAAIRDTVRDELSSLELAGRSAIIEEEAQYVVFEAGLDFLFEGREAPRPEVPWRRQELPDRLRQNG